MRKRFKIPIGVLLVFLLAVAITLIFVIKTNFLERQANEWLKRSLEKKYGLKITLGDIGGSIFTGFHVSDITVDYESGEKPYRMASIKYVDISYNLYDLVRSQWIIHHLMIDSLKVTIRKRQDGSLDIPDFSGKGGDGGEAGGIDFAVERFVLANSSFSLDDRLQPIEIDDINVLMSLAKDANRYQAEIDTSSLLYETKNLELKQLAGTFTMVDSTLEAEDVRVVTDSSEINLAASVKTIGEYDFDATLGNSRVNFTELSRFVHADLHGDLAVRGSVDRKMGKFGADIVINGTFKDWQFSDLETALSLDRKMITVKSLNGRAFGGTLDGSGFFDLGESPECYRFVGRVQNLNLNGAVEGSFESDLSGSVVLDGCGLTSDDLSLDFDLDLSHGQFDAYSFDSLSGSCRVTADSIILRYPFNAYYKSTSVSAGGRIEYSGRMDLEAQASLPAIGEFENEIFLKDIGGRGEANVTLRGPTTDPSLTGNFTSDSVRVYDFTSRDMYCLLDIQHFFTTPVGGVEIFSDKFDYNGFNGEWAYASLGISKNFVTLENVSAALDPVELYAVGTLDISSEDSLILTMHELTAEVDSETVRLQEDANFSFKDSGINILDFQITDGVDRASVMGSYLYDGSLDLVFAYDNLIISKWLPYISRDYVVDGRLSGDGVIKGSLVDPALQFDIAGQEMVLGDEEIGDLSGLISFADSSLVFRGLTLRGSTDTTTIDGYIPLNLTFEGGDSRLLNNLPMDVSVAMTGVTLETWLPYFYSDRKFGGKLAANGKIYGTFLDPMFKFDIGVQEMTLDGEGIGELLGRISYSDSSLQLHSLSLQSDVTKYEADGYLPLDLTFAERESRLLKNQPMNIAVSVSGTSFDLVDEFFEDIEWLEGQFVLSATLSGTPAEITFDGSIRVDNGRCKLYYIEDPISDLQFLGEFNGRKLSIRQFDGKLVRKNKSGSFSATGQIDLTDLTKPNYDIRINGSNLPVKYDLGDIEVRIRKLDLAVEGSSPPKITGDVNLDQMLYEEPFYSEVEESALEAADTASSVDYNIRIDIPQNMWIKNEDADVELKGNLIVLKEGTLENFLGTLETIRGKIYLAKLGRTFTVLPGGTITFDEIETFNPRLDIQMTTTIRDSTGVRDVCMQLTRTLNDPNIDVCPGSDLTIDEVWTYMNPISTGFGEPTLSDTTSNGRSSLGGRLTVGAAGIASNQVSRLVSRRLGVETFEINTAAVGRSLNPWETELTIGFYTTPRLYIYGTSQLTFGKTEELGFDYRLSNRVYISGQRDRNNLYHLNLTLSWEFK